MSLGCGRTPGKYQEETHTDTVITNWLNLALACRECNVLYYYYYYAFSLRFDTFNGQTESCFFCTNADPATRTLTSVHANQQCVWRHTPTNVLLISVAGSISQPTEVVIAGRIIALIREATHYSGFNSVPIETTGQNRDSI